MKKFTLLFAAILAVSMSFATTVTKTVESLATELSWTNGNVCTPFALDNAITVSTTATDANTGKYYSNGQQIRLYQTGSATITLTAGEGYSISSVALTYASQNTGILLDATGAAYESGADFAVNAQAVTFSVGNSGAATNGQARITAFEVVYNAAGDTTVVPVDTTVVPGDTTIVPIVVIDTTEITCAQARELALALSANNQPTEEWYAVTGFITEVVGNVSRNQQTFWMADTLEGGRVFEGYWANLPESIEAFEVGMQVKMIGHLMKYNTTPEIKNGEVTILAMPVPVDTTSQDTTPVIVPVTMETLTFKAGVWKQDSAKFGAWVWGNSLDGQFTDFFTPLLGGEDTYSGLIPETADSIVFVRFADTVTVPAWGNGIVWNQTINYAVNHADMFFSMNDDWSTGVWGTPVPVIDTTAITCAQARELALALPANNQPTEEWYAVTGYITEVVSNVSRNQQTFWMADSLEGGRVFEGYWANLPDNIEAFEVGMQVTMIGHLMKYNTTPEIKNGEVIILAMPVIPEPVHYYIKNNWDGGDWTWQEMNMVMNNVIYEYTGVFGGTGVNINTAASDEGSTWFPVENFSVLDSTYVPQALDTLHFVYSIVDSVLAVELVGRPAPAPVQYYIKNNWNGAADWTWQEMNMVIDNVLYEYTGVFGGSGVNINTVAEDNGSTWFPVENFRTLDSTFVPQASDTIHFVYSIVDSVLAVELVGRPAADTLHHYYIKNNWNGGADWGWVEMNMVMDNVLYEYTGVFGGTGVNINTAASDEGSTWFPVENFSVLDSTYVPQALDTIHFVYSIVDSVLAVELVGRPAPAPVQYYIKNNWNGAADWSWVEMNMVIDNVLYEYTGVFGGTGVNINTAASDEGSTWFPVENFSVLDSTYVPQALDTIHFVYSIVDSVLAVELVGRPEPIIHDTVVTGIHIMDQTGWAQLNLYMWGDAGELFGAWPGLDLDEIVTGEGDEGYFISIVGGYEGLEGNLIFNDGNGIQFPDLTIALVDTVYEIVVRADGAYFADQVPAEALTIAEATATDIDTELKTRGIVTYINGKNAYIQDATAGILLYNAAAAFTNFSVGDEIIVNAKRAVYGNAPELSNVTLDTILSFGNTVRPITMTLAERAAEPLKNFGMMIRVKSLTIVSFDRYNNPTVTDGVNNAVCYKMSVDTTAFHVGDVVDITAIASFFNGTIQFQGDIAGITMHEEDHYYIKNNWNGGAWTWEEMSPVLDNVLYEYTGVFGGTGVNINTTAADEGSIWFPVENFSLIDSTYVPQALDTIHFVYSIVDAALAVELVGRPAGDSVLHYYIKNNWEAGSEWTWVEMDMVVDSAVYEYTGVFGGTGVNINTMATDAGAIWFPVEDFRTIDSTYVPQALDTIHFVYSIVDATLAVELVGRPVIEEIQYYIKNNWNGGEWTWEEMTPANDGNITWTYRGIFGGTGVNINNLPIDADAIWFPVDEWLFTTLGYVPEAGDDILFEFDSELLTLTASFMGEDGLETITFQREGETMKLIHNGQLYIIRDGKMYNALGAQVR